MIEAKLYATLRTLADGNKSVMLDPGTPSVAAALAALIAAHPSLRDGLLADDGSLRSFVAVMVNGRDVRHLDGLDTPLADNATLDIFPPVAGGAATARA
jgi:molybdopterin synthase sulfur carrier subunit